MLLFTQEDLLLYLYKETSPEQTSAIASALTSDWNLVEMLNYLKDSIGLLNEEIVAPRFETVLNILKYARETMAEATV